jgi:hypothetical protein
MFTSKCLLTFFALVPSFAWFNSAGIWKKSEPSSLHEKRSNLSEATLLKFKQKSTEVLPFIRKNHFNSQLCFFVDMSISSGKKRFFVYDLSGDSVLKQGLVAHGSCDAGFQVSPTFSNKVNSGCSATGKYKIGGSYFGTFGLAYKLHGLDSSNSNAYNRNIVLHSYSCVPDEETGSTPLCNSRGCPMVSPGFLDQLKPIINSSGKPILLWIFE